MARSLPPNPSLRFLREQAKDLHKAHKAGDAGACETLRRLNRFANATDGEIFAAEVPLKEVQFALAMEYGFKSWPELKAHVQGQRDAERIKSVHVRMRMRTPPGDNFHTIGLDYDFAPIELWQVFTDPPRWRIEEPGRVVVMGGSRQTTLCKGTKHAWERPTRGFSGPVGSLLNVDGLLDRERRRARTEGSQWNERKELGSEGKEKLVATEKAQARGDFSESDWLKNQSINDSDHTTTLHFDAATALLEELQVVVHAEGRDVLVFEVLDVEYNVSIAPRLFQLDLPADAIWHAGPEILPDNDRYEQMSPPEAARAYFEAMAAEDWDEAIKFETCSRVDEDTKRIFGGLEIIHIGEAFRSGDYAGWFIPYEIRLPNDRVKKHCLAMRKDNRARRLVVDGGI